MTKNLFISLLTALVITWSILLFWEEQAVLIYPNGQGSPANPIPTAYLVLGGYTLGLIAYQIYHTKKK